MGKLLVDMAAWQAPRMLGLLFVRWLLNRYLAVTAVRWVCCCYQLEGLFYSWSRYDH